MLIFDLDGTTLNTLTDLTNSVNYVMNLHGCHTRTESEIKSFLGNGIRRLIELSVPESCPPDLTETIYNEFLAYYKEHSLDNTKPYDGICEALTALKNNGYILCTVSNKADIVVKGLVERFFGGIFDYSTGQKEGVNKKPAPDSVNFLLKRFRIERNAALCIGDSEVDFETGRNAGTDVMLVTYGFRDKEFLKSLNAEYLVDSASEITDIL